MTKVHIWPTPDEIGMDNGIGRIIKAQYELLPEYGIELVPFTQAEVIAAHTQQAHLPRVDVLHCHGIYWTGDPNSGKYNSWHDTANQKIMEAARRSLVVTVPSDWVQRPFQYDMRINPVVLNHGIDLKEWNVTEDKEDFVLWNKNRREDVCNPKPAIELAKRGVKVISTFDVEGGSGDIPTLTIVGKMSHPEMKQLLGKAKIYLATTQETYGVGTVEAMAVGLPVLGFDWGGTADLVRHKINGYLVRPYDYQGLYEGYIWLMDNWEACSYQARMDAESHDWPKEIEKYAALYSTVAKMPVEETVGIVITNHNYAQYVGDAIKSALNQTVCDEVIVVDDGSTDKSREVIDTFAKNPKVKILYIENQGVAAARNLGIEAAHSDFIICLDADDGLHPKYSEVLQREMKANRDYGIAYTGLTILRENGDQSGTTWPPEFSWELMASKGTPPPNCIPSASMFRKSMWQRAGGYRQALHPAEDVELWVRGLSMGFTAKKITPDPLFLYRTHQKSASRTNPYKPIDAWLPFISDKKFPMAAPSIAMPKVSSHHFPVVSVIIPMSRDHAKLVQTAIESIVGQSFRNWEIILVDDSGKHLGIAMKKQYPFITYLSTTTKRNGVAHARNMGIEVARSSYVLFLDADDYLHPAALTRLIETAVQNKLNPNLYYYSDYRLVEDSSIAEAMDYNPHELKEKLFHAVTALVPTAQARRITFDTELPVLEDWDFYIRSAIGGCYGLHLPEPLLYVRTAKRTRTIKSRKAVITTIRERYENQIGDIPMSCCPTGRVATTPPTENDPLGNGLVRMKFTGPGVGGTTWGGPGRTPSGRSYVGGNNAFDRFADVAASDVDWLKSFGVWEVVETIPDEPVMSVLETVNEPAVSLPDLDDVLAEALAEPTKKVRGNKSV